MAPFLRADSGGERDLSIEEKVLLILSRFITSADGPPPIPRSEFNDKLELIELDPDPEPKRRKRKEESMTRIFMTISTVCYYPGPQRI